MELVTSIYLERNSAFGWTRLKFSAGTAKLTCFYILLDVPKIDPTSHTPEPTQNHSQPLFPKGQRLLSHFFHGWLPTDSRHTPTPISSTKDWAVPAAAAPVPRQRLFWLVPLFDDYISKYPINTWRFQDQSHSYSMVWWFMMILFLGLGCFFLHFGVSWPSLLFHLCFGRQKAGDSAWRCRIYS